MLIDVQICPSIKDTQRHGSLTRIGHSRFQETECFVPLGTRATQKDGPPIEQSNAPASYETEGNSWWPVTLPTLNPSGTVH